MTVHRRVRVKGLRAARRNQEAVRVQVKAEVREVMRLEYGEQGVWRRVSEVIEVMTYSEHRPVLKVKNFGSPAYIL